MIRSLVYLLIITTTWAFACSEPQKSCTYNSDCGEGYFCVETLCVPSSEVRTCSTKGDCRSGEVCFERRCFPEVCTPGETKPCSGEEKGECSPGVKICNKAGSGYTPYCLGLVKPAEEGSQCDGLDNDCDGEVDEGLDCSCQKRDTRSCRVSGSFSNGHCRAGTQLCEEKDGKLQWGPCLGRVSTKDLLPLGLTCSITDLNCDGDVDDNDGKSIIYTERPVSCRCLHTDQPRACKRFSETNNSSCNMGTQYCLRESALRKGEDPTVASSHCKEGDNCLWSDCKANTSEVKGEECDGKDNDCDGKIDNIPGTDTPYFEACNDTEKDCIATCKDGSLSLCKDKSGAVCQTKP